jgi:hypothetical protein
MTLVMFIALCFTPAIVFHLCGRGVDWWTRLPIGGFRRARNRRKAPPLNRVELVDRYRRDLVRLSADHARLMSDPDLPARAAKVWAVRLAYDDTLVRACHDLQVTVPPPPMDAATRVLVEADLALHGLTW